MVTTPGEASPVSEDEFPVASKPSEGRVALEVQA